jgi:soluble lytic murein transglycosylase-like protein
MTFTRKNDTGTAPSRARLLRDAARQAEARGAPSVEAERRGRAPGTVGTLAAWEAERRDRIRRRIAAVWAQTRSPARLAIAVSVAFLMGIQMAARPDGARVAGLENQARESRNLLQARQGELQLVRMELDRLQEIMEYSRQYGIPADLAAAINDLAIAEGIAPAVAFQLVRVESGFYRRAISPMGAVGLAQLMPPTAFELDPNLQYADLFDRETNLRLGFRYLRQMIDKYNGDLRLALLAYNRGPGTVDSILREGGDPSNGYARAVMSGLP